MTTFELIFSAAAIIGWFSMALAGATMVSLSITILIEMSRRKLDVKKFSSMIKLSPILTTLFMIAICASIASVGAKMFSRSFQLFLDYFTPLADYAGF